MREKVRQHIRLGIFRIWGIPEPFSRDVAGKDSNVGIWAKMLP